MPSVSTLILNHVFNPLNAELNPICHLLALLGAHHILYVGRIKVKLSFSIDVHESVHHDIIRKQPTRCNYVG
jgi:hypothetical protein